MATGGIDLKSVDEMDDDAVILKYMKPKKLVSMSSLEKSSLANRLRNFEKIKLLGKFQSICIILYITVNMKLMNLLIIGFNSLNLPILVIDEVSLQCCQWLN